MHDITRPPPLDGMMTLTRDFETATSQSAYGIIDHLRGSDQQEIPKPPECHCLTRLEVREEQAPQHWVGLCTMKDVRTELVPTKQKIHIPISASIYSTRCSCYAKLRESYCPRQTASPRARHLPQLRPDKAQGQDQLHLQQGIVHQLQM